MALWSAAGVGGAMLALAVVGAAFTTNATPPPSSLTAVALDAYVPATVTASRLDASTCRVTWTASAATGAPGSLTYDVTDGTTTLATGVNGLTTDLSTSADVTPRVKARTGTWVSAAATTSAQSCAGPPGAPTSLSGTAGDGQVAATWTAPASNGGSAITGYTLTATPSTGSPSTCTATPPATGCTATGLTNGMTYTLTVTATNAWGTSPASTAATVIPYPASIVTGSATKVWLDAQAATTMFSDAAGTTPATAGGPVQRWKTRLGTGWDAVKPAAAGSPTLGSALINGKPAVRFDRTHPDYLEVTTSGIGAVGSTDRSLFVVAAMRTTADNTTNAYGALAVWPGMHSGLTGSGHPSVSTLGGSGWTSASSIVNAWTAAGSSPLVGSHVASSGSGAVTSAVAVNGGGLTTTSVSGSWRSYPDLLRVGAANIAPTTTYQENLDGDIGEILVLDRAVTAAERRTVEEYLARKWGIAVTPSAPSAVTAAPGDGQATVSWTAPWNGGSAITGSTVTASPGGATCTTTGTGCTVTGLTNGTTYTFTVTATNAVGTGPASSSVTAIPYPAAVMTSGRLALWLDGADSAGYFQDSAGTTAATTGGQPVGQWRDKSTQAGHAVQGTSGARPTLATVSGRLVPTFDGSAQFLNLTPAKLPTGSASSTQFVVAGLSDAVPAWTWVRVALGWGDGGWNTTRQIYKGGFNGTPTTDLGTWSAQAADGTWGGGPTIVANEFTASSNSIWASGRRPGGTAGALWPNTATTSATVGKNPASGNTDYWYGPIPEVIVLNTTITAAERRQVEEYLARKWSTVITPTAPSPAPTVTAGDGSIAASWSAPSWNGGSAVTGYTATATSSTGGATGSCTVSVPTTTCTITGLDNGATYTVTVAATNAAGTGPSSSASSSVIPYPATIMTSARMRLWLDGADTATMFQDTAATTGATASGQTVARWNDKSGQGGSVQQSTAGSRPTLALLNGRPVPTFNGSSSFMSLVNVPQLPSGTAASTEIAVASSSEANPAGSGYRFIWQRGDTTTGAGRAMWKGNLTTQMRADMTGTGVATNGTIQSNTPLVAVAQYASAALDFFTAGRSGVNASGAFSTGTSFAYLGRNNTTYHWAGPIPEIIVLNTTVSAAERRALEEYLSRKWGAPIIPSTPTAVSATPGNAAATVSWTPGYDGGATTTYTATTNTGATCSTTGSSCTIGGLTNGTTYTVTVTPSNSVGTGTASSPAVSVTPRTVPGAPTGVTLTPGNTQLGVGWTAPASDGGSAITGYTATASPGGATCTATPPTTSCTLTGLTNGTSYTVTVTATNAAGTGAASSGASGTPTANPVTNSGFETGTLAGWTCSANDAIVTSPVRTGTYAARATYVNPDKARCSQTVSGLSPNTSYTYRIWVNGTGTYNIGYNGSFGSGSTGAAASGTWTQVTRSFNTGSATSVTVWFEVTSGFVTFDDVSLTSP